MKAPSRSAGRLPTHCPSCAGELLVRRLVCTACDVSVEGRFDLGVFRGLTPENWEFVRHFLLARGKLKELEQRLDISYPTVVARLEKVVELLEGSASELAPALETLSRGEVLDRVAAGTLSLDEAVRQLERPTEQRP